MKTNDFDYFLPEELIAQTPIYPRDCSRLLVYDRAKNEIGHKIFKDVLEYFNTGDVLVINDTKVLPARIYAKTEHGGQAELLLLKRIEMDLWECLVKPGKKAKIGTIWTVNEELKAEIVDFAEEGGRIVKFIYQGVFEDILSRAGEMPLPPYIHEKLKDQSRYQTVYCKTEGSAAAPTAGLHFTPELLQKLQEKGVKIARVLLHVGLGTFRPVKVDDISEHHMHTEYYCIDEENAEIINTAKKNGNKVFAVGTTSVRTLETVADESGFVKACSGNTSIFIFPGYKFKCVDSLITNFHLPKSTLIMLVSAFAGREQTLDIYNTAVKERYRFFSFGDAMLLL